MIDEVMQNGVYIITKYRTLEDLNLLCSFPYRNIKRYEHYEKMLSLGHTPL